MTTRQLGLALEDRGRHVRQHHRVAVADDRAGRLLEGVDRRRLGARAVLHVVDRHAARSSTACGSGGRMRTWLSGTPWLCAAPVQSAAIVGEPLDQTR